MSAKYVINQIHRFNFLAVNDFRVNLRSLYVGMAEQLARGIKIRTEGKHHCGERVAARVIGDFFIDSCRCHPFGQYLVYVGFGRKPGKDSRFIPFAVSLGKPTDGMAGERQVNRRGGLLDVYKRQVLFLVLNNIFPS